MTNEQKAAVERAADNINETLSVYASYYGHIVAGMTHVIDNAAEFGLMPILDNMDHIEESDQNWSEAVDDLKSQLTKLQSELEFYKRRADHDPNSPFNKLVNAVDKKLAQLLGEQKKDGKKFISDEEVDQLIDKIVREELGNDTGRS